MNASLRVLQLVVTVVVGLCVTRGVSADAARPDDQAKPRPITVTGCVERLATTRTPFYRVVVTEPDGEFTIYHLEGVENTAIPSALGKRVRVTGVLTIERRIGRDTPVLTVETVEIVADHCRISVSRQFVIRPGPPPAISVKARAASVKNSSRLSGCHFRGSS